MTRLTFLFAAVALLAAAGSGATSKKVERQLAFAHLVSPSFGVAAAYDVRPKGSITLVMPRLFLWEGGSSWRRATPGSLYEGESVEDAVFLGRAHGWVAVNDCSAGKAFVYRTHTSGQHWTRASVDGVNCAGGSFMKLFFLNRRQGWMLENAGNATITELFRTTDGGARWTQRGGHYLPARGAVVFRSLRDGWLSATDEGYFRPGQLFETRDGGRTWRHRRLPAPKGWSRARLFPDIPTFFGKDGVLPVTLVRGRHCGVAFYITANGGGTWHLAAVRTVQFAETREIPLRHLLPTSVASPTHWWVAAGRGRPRVLFTTDEGKHWRHSPPVGARARYWDVSSAAGKSAWLTSFTFNKGALYTTNDGGISWHRKGMPPIHTTNP